MVSKTTTSKADRPPPLVIVGTSVFRPEVGWAEAEIGAEQKGKTRRIVL